MELSEILKKAQSVNSGKELKQWLEENNLSFQWLRFSGSRKGFSEVSKKIGSYNTVRHGWLDEFSQSSKKLGDSISMDGKEYVVVRNFYGAGSPEFPAEHTLGLLEVES